MWVVRFFVADKASLDHIFRISRMLSALYSSVPMISERLTMSEGKAHVVLKQNI